MNRFVPTVSCPLESKIICTCKHRLHGTGVFFQGLGIIYCLDPACHGLQKIRKPVDKKNPLD